MTGTYKMTIAYDGTCYAGWQVQPNGLSIQQVLQQALKIALREEIGVTGAGRTDSGVHAAGQAAHFQTEQVIDLFRLQGALNGLLPADIRILKLEAVADGFHARYSALAKIYHYHLWLDKQMSPFKRLYSLHVKERIDPLRLFVSAPYFLGTHDFRSFANEGHAGCAAKDSIRTIQRLDVIEQEGGLRLEFEGNGFLYKMVRNIVGTLLEIGSNKRSPLDIPLIIAARDRRQAGQTAPAHGLFLIDVQYPPSFLSE